MRALRGTYVHRGDAVRRRRRLEQLGIAVAGIAVTTAAFLVTRHPATASAAPASIFTTDAGSVARELMSARGELSMLRSQFERADKVMQYSTKYGITAGLAGKVFDASLREGLDPELGFRLVRLESDFHERAVSKAGAIGLTQLMPSTATRYEKGATRSQLVEGETNLRIGFHYLRTLLSMFKGDVRLALLAYNRGEDAVSRDVRRGVDPGNGYDRFVMRDYRGTGLITAK